MFKGKSVKTCQFSGLGTHFKPAGIFQNTHFSSCHPRVEGKEWHHQRPRQSSGYSELIPPKKIFKKDTIDGEASHTNRSMKLKQTLFVIHFKNRKKAFQHEPQTTGQTAPFHYDRIFQWCKFALDTCTQCRPIFVKRNKVKILLNILQLWSK